jgi:hypothetical protein
MRCFWRCVVLNDGYNSFYRVGHQTIWDIIISTHPLSLLKARCAYYVFRSTPRALRRLSCPICAMSELPGRGRGVKAWLRIFHSPTPKTKGIGM